MCLAQNSTIFFIASGPPTGLADTEFCPLNMWNIVILSGSGKTHGQIQYTKDEGDLSIGSIVYTSGSGGIFKSGIPIGKIIFDRNTNSKVVDFFTDLSQLTFVKLITFEKDLQKWLE